MWGLDWRRYGRDDRHGGALCLSGVQDDCAAPNIPEPAMFSPGLTWATQDGCDAIET
jgi:hypothetical protein